MIGTKNRYAYYEQLTPLLALAYSDLPNPDADNE
jgi:hypothetical protein